MSPIELYDLCRVVQGEFHRMHEDNLNRIVEVVAHADPHPKMGKMWCCYCATGLKGKDRLTGEIETSKFLNIPEANLRKIGGLTGAFTGRHVGDKIVDAYEKIGDVFRRALQNE